MRDVARLRPTSPSQSPETPESKAASRKPGKSGASPVLPAKPQKRSTPAQQAPLDPKTRQKLVRGQISIDARLDLHGMRQDEAHHRLVQFVDTSFRRGLRTVLVITGKGSGGGDVRPGRYAMNEGRGVLRTNVPRWLAEPHLRARVWSVAEAGPRHGGSGAYYVMLRRNSP